MKLRRPNSYVDVAVGFFATLGFLGMSTLGLYAFIFVDTAFVDGKGRLHEPYFFMLPLGHGLIWLGLGAIVLLLFSRFVWRLVAASAKRRKLAKRSNIKIDP